ncbi:MAG: hypothetical protein UD936_09980 [Acutalibacteraceae bacterium]|nr:hypothetical protein [Acutalibacteraceae bacterium]
MKKIFIAFGVVLIIVFSAVSAVAVDDTTVNFTEPITETITEQTTETITEYVTEEVTEEPTEDLTAKFVNISEYQYSIMLIVSVILIFGLCVLLLK